MHTEAIKTLVPTEVYTDRQEFLDYFYEYALKAITRRAMSTVLLGQRRMGKTEIFKRVVNRLFFEQDHTDPKALVPVYYSFRDDVIDRWEFSLEYIENFLRWYAAFRLGDATILSDDGPPSNKLATFIKNNVPMTRGLSGALKVRQGIAERTINLPEKRALWAPRNLSDWDDSTIVIFLDEFQNTRLPNDSFSIVGFMQEAVESPTCPHFVTGSAVSILAKEILGRGALFGRFESDPINPLTEYWGAELALKTAHYYQASLTELMAPVVATRCGGNPFYITAVIKQAAKQKKAITDETSLNNILAVDLSSGFIWAELNDQVMKWIKRVNDYGITKWVLYLSALEEGDRIEPAHIQQQLLEKDGTQVDVDTIKDILIRLSRGDLLEYMELGGWFRKVDDPILLDFLKAWGRFEVEGHSQTQVMTETIESYATLKRQINDQKGYLAEVYISQILWNCQRKTIPGKYFNSQTDVTLPHRFYDIRQRIRLEAIAGSEIDVYASTGTENWLCESKWWQSKKVGPKVVEDLVTLGEKFKTFKGYEHFEEKGPLNLKLWLFAHNGVTAKAKDLLEKHNIYWSTRDDLDALIKLAGLRPLSDTI